ncbi:diacylglycerol/lipid kinase family protein [Bacteroidota bacterium]
MKNRFFFIVINPKAGQRKYNWKLDRLKLALEERQFQYEVYFTSPEKKADEVIKDNLNPEKISDLVVFGGDGTLHEVINGVGDRGIPISVISTGTGNDSVKPLYKKRRFLDQLHIALDGKIKEVDAGICNDRLFINGLGIGFDGKVVELMQTNFNKQPGYISYLQTVLKILATYKESELSFTIDDKSFNEACLLLTIGNGTTFGGGFKITPQAKMDDGLLDVCIMGKITPWKRFLHLPKMKNGTHGKIKTVQFAKGKEIIIDATDDAVAHIDGEYFSNPPFNIKVLPNHLLFRIPS